MDKQVVGILDKTWDSFQLLFAGGCQPGGWDQEPYKSDFFQAFADVYAIQRMHGDEVKDFLRERHLSPDDPQYDEKLAELTELCGAWSEWDYAWRKFPSD